MSAQNHVSNASAPSDYCTLFNPCVDSVVEELVRTVSALRDASPVEITPLYRVVDSDALETLFDESATRKRPSHRVVTFDYEGFEVTIRSPGCIALDPIEAT
ncbi:HalOD1 output domain-containing protein [Haloprofundus salinisoli]|uniref:HalOD1 output domain-containing protein n=1 Tax=Haloprofundus salinisoli TaxID=2876193 RepID=UPI001CCD1C90|nr:HalOD1 output domain-containing protein [Haloprofundus salinisoli]